MNEITDFLSTRRTIPAAFLSPPGPDADQLRTILTIAARVPDHGKIAPWRFVLIEGEARAAVGGALLALRERRVPGLSEAARAEERGRFLRAPLVVVLVSRARPHPKAPQWEQQLSAGAVGMNLLNAAHALGFAAQWLTDWPAYDPQARALLGLAEDERLAGFFYIGTPTVPPQERPRPDIDDLATRWEPQKV